MSFSYDLTQSLNVTLLRFELRAAPGGKDLYYNNTDFNDLPSQVCVDALNLTRASPSGLKEHFSETHAHSPYTRNQFQIRLFINDQTWLLNSCAASDVTVEKCC